MGNAWSQRRRIITRPQVCKPPPPPLVPVADFTCEFDEPTITIGEGETATVQYQIQNTKCGPFDIFTVTALYEDAGFTYPSLMTNGESAEIQYDGMQPAGTYRLTLEATDCFGTTCTASWIITVTPLI